MRQSWTRFDIIVFIWNICGLITNTICYLEYLWFSHEHDLLCGKDLFDLYDPKSAGHSNDDTETSLALSQPQSVSTSSVSLKKLHIKIRNTDYVIPFLNHYSDTIEEMMLSLELGYQESLSPVHPMNRLVSLVVSYVENPVVLATLLPKLPLLQILEFNDSHMGDSEFINALQNVDTLEELKFCNGTYTDLGDMVDLFDAYAEAATIATSSNNSTEENNDVNCSLSDQQQYKRRQLAHVTLIGCEFIEDSVLDALGNINTLASVSIGFAPLVTTKGVNAFCEQLNLLSKLSSISFAGLDCVEDSTLSILGSSSTATISHDITKVITLQTPYDVTKEALNQLSKKQGVSLILHSRYSSL